METGWQTCALKESTEQQTDVIIIVFEFGFEFNKHLRNVKELGVVDD